MEKPCQRPGVPAQPDRCESVMPIYSSTKRGFYSALIDEGIGVHKQ